MHNGQYFDIGFKPCYKWNTFNTNVGATDNTLFMCFKPCYKWNTFNTESGSLKKGDMIKF